MNDANRLTFPIMRPNKAGGADTETLVISQGIGSDGPWGVYRRKANGSLKRVVSPACPLRGTAEESELDLALWCVTHELSDGPIRELFARLAGGNLGSSRHAEARSAAVYPGEEER